MKKLLTASIIGILSGSAYAGPVYVNTGFDYNTDGDSVTSQFDEFGYSGTRSTSFYLKSELDQYFADPSSIASLTVRDTNIKPQMTLLGFNTSYQTSIAGNTVDYIPGGSIQPYAFNTVAPDSNFDTLNPLDTTIDDAENFNQVNGWGLWYQYDISGVLDIAAGQSNYNNGFINAYFYDQAAFSVALAALGGPITEEKRLQALSSVSTQVLNMIVESSYNDPGGLHLVGYADYTFATSDFQKNFLNDVDRAASFYTLWAAGDGKNIDWILDTNVDPVFPTPQSLVSGDGDYYYRQGRLDGSLIFNVPEPATLTLMGLGFIGIGAASRRKKV